MTQIRRIEPSRPPTSEYNGRKIRHFFELRGDEFYVEHYTDETGRFRTFIGREFNDYKQQPPWLPTHAIAIYGEHLDPLIAANLLEVLAENWDRAKEAGAAEARHAVRKALGITR